MFHHQTNRNHATDLSATDHIISERHLNITFSFTEITKETRSKVRNGMSKRETNFQLFSEITDTILKAF